MSTEADKKATITAIARHWHHTLGDSFRFCDADGSAWFMSSAGGARRLSEKEAEALVARVIETASIAREMKPPRLDARERRWLLSAAGVLCLRASDPFAGVVCPRCLELAALRPIGVASLGELVAR